MDTQEFYSSDGAAGLSSGEASRPKSLSVSAVVFEQHAWLVSGLMVISFVAAILLSPVSAQAASQVTGTAVNTDAAPPAAESVAQKADPAGFQAYKPVHLALGETPAAMLPVAYSTTSMTTMNRSEFSSMENNTFTPAVTLPGSETNLANESDAAVRMPLVALAWLFGIAVIGMGTVGRRKQSKP